MMIPEHLETLTVKQLADLARKSGISGWHEMRKVELISALKKSVKAAKAAKNSKTKHASNTNPTAPTSPIASHPIISIYFSPFNYSLLFVTSYRGDAVAGQKFCDAYNTASEQYCIALGGTYLSTTGGTKRYTL